MNIDLNTSLHSEDEELCEDEMCLAGSTDRNLDTDPDSNPDNDLDSNLADNDPATNRKNEHDSISDIDPDCDVDSVEYLKKIVEKKIGVGSIIDTLDEVYILYCEYARLMGFSVKNGTQSYFLNTMIVRVKVYHCSCEGYPDNKASIGVIPCYKKQSTRIYCKARLRVVRDDKEGPWKVFVFQKQHNHELVDPEESYLLRLARNMSQSKKTLFVALSSSGVGVGRAFRFLEKKAGGRKNVGFLPRDAYSAMNRERRLQLKVENGDANILLEYLTQKGMNDPSFYWKVKLSEEGRLKNLFLRDTRCLLDYQLSGDVLSVDSTFKTNKYDLVCVPLIGINHHRSNVIFGIAFLSNETTESYEWLFGSSLESMYQKEPSIIFSYQDQALMNGLDYTFRHACHRLCQWHINKNATKLFSKLNHNRDFKNMWHRCMNGCETGDEFESS